MIYYNQNDYANIKYPAAGYEGATVKTSGCGVCCASMIVENLTDSTFPPKASAEYALSIGARVSGGTDMKKLASALCNKFNLNCSTSTDTQVLCDALSNGDMAICNVGGNRSGYTGVFSNGGHYIVACKYENGKIGILDPGYYNGKYSIEGRTGKVTMTGNIANVTPEVLNADCLSRNPKYYIFRKRA